MSDKLEQGSKTLVDDKNSKTAVTQEIFLGHGVFSIGSGPSAIDFALTRGGGQFLVEYEYREIVADGDKGPVKDRIAQDRAVPKLVINTLKILKGVDFPKMYASVKATTVESKVKITGNGKIDTASYNDVTWTGTDIKGKAIKITVKNAINLENIDWTMVEKDEIVPSLTYTGCYAEGSKDEPWEIEM